MGVTLNWATAEVQDGKLTVDLEGEVPSGWKKRFQTTVRLLGGGNWGEIACKKQTVRVTEVQPGDEEKLRHFLESAVDQANAGNEPSESSSADAPREDAPSEGDGPDAAMTDQFRSFSER